MDEDISYEHALKCSMSGDFFITHKVSDISIGNYHYNNGHSILYSRSCGVQLFVRDKPYFIEKGHLFVFNDTDIIKVVVPPGVTYDRYIVYFKPEYIQDISTSRSNLLDCFINRDSNFRHGILLSEEQSQDLVFLFERALFYYEISDKPIYGVDIYLKILLAEILIMVNSFFKSADTLSPFVNRKDYEKTRLVTDYINFHLSEDISLEALANTFYMNKSYLGRIFKKATGFTVNSYITAQRISNAKSLLKEGLPVTKVSEAVGFTNLPHFIRTFKKQIGFSPKQFAKRC